MCVFLCMCAECVGGQWSDMLQGCNHSNSRMGQWVAMAPRSQGQGEGPGGPTLASCVCVYVGGMAVNWWNREVSSQAIVGVLIMNGSVCDMCACV